MISMTGYAYQEWAEGDISVSVEIKGYNSRFLEIYISTPPWLSYFEPKIRQLAGDVCGRGKVDIALRVREINTPLIVSVNTNAAGAYMKAVNNLARELGIDDTASLSMLIGMDGVLNIEKNRDDSRYWDAAEPVLQEALKAFAQERAREGSHTRESILVFLGEIESAMNIICRHIPELENTIKENIQERFRELAATEIDENRILAETAILLMKHTISEEVSRLLSHLGEFREAAMQDRTGKKLDFLCQEINREINTIGSKSTVLEVSRIVVGMKESLENIREQLRNVE